MPNPQEAAKRLTRAYQLRMGAEIKRLVTRATRAREENKRWNRYKKRAAAAIARSLESNDSTGRRRAALEVFSARLVRNMREAAAPRRGARASADKLTDVQVLAEAITNREKYAEVWDATLQQLRDEAGDNEESLRGIDALAELPVPMFGASRVDRVVRTQMRRLRMDLGRLVRQHYKRQDLAGRALEETLVAEAGLEKESAEILAATVRRRFAALLDAKKRRELEKILKPVRRLRLARPGLEQRLIELSNLGAIGEERYWRALQEQLELPEWTPALAARVNDLAQRIGALPEDRVEDRQKLSVQMLNELERARGFGSLDLGLAFYVTNLLTGVTTHAKNIISTTLNSMAGLGSELGRAVVAGRLDDIPLMMEALAVGVRKGARAAQDVWQTGMVTGTRVLKVEPGRLLELSRFGHRGGVATRGRMTRAVLESRLARVLNAWKYNYRAMGAEDMLLFKATEEVKVALLAKRQARTEGLRGAEAQARARAILGYGLAAVEAAEDQAAREGKTGAAASRRAAEILEQLRPEQMRETAADYGRRVTFNGEPYGVLGQIAQLINQAKGSDNRKLATAAMLIAPFTNIVANVVNESLNYTPVGALRAWRGKQNLLGHELGEMDPADRAELRAELYAKATLGTVMLVGLALYGAQYLDDEDPWFAIYGAGPFDTADRRGWQATGGIPHSIKVGDRYYSYAATPMALGLAALGNTMDRIRDDRIYRVKSAGRVAQSWPLSVASSLLGMARVVTEQSFLVGMMDLFDVVGEKSPERSAQGGIRLAVRTSSSFVVPNLVRQVDKFFDPTIYEARSLEEQLVNAVPFARTTGRPALNALGLPVQNPLQSQFTSTRRTDNELVTVLAQRGLWPSLPDRNQVYPRQGRPMTDDEYYKYVQMSGETARRMLTRTLPQLRRYNDENARRYVAAVYEQSRALARSRQGF